MEAAHFAQALRSLVVEMVSVAGSGHVAGPLGMAEIYAVLFTEVLQHRPDNPSWPERDRLILSCGHTAPARYASMALSGYFSVHELLTLRQLGSRLQGHPSTAHLPGLESNSGSLGQGLSIACGLALEARRTGQLWQTYCIASDGEHEEGQTWEAVQFAGTRALSNLTVIIDRNRIQIDGPTDTIIYLDGLAAMYAANGWEVTEINGNDLQEVRRALVRMQPSQKPHCIVAHTVPGKGVSSMENMHQWHGKAPNRVEAIAALEEVLQ